MPIQPPKIRTKSLEALYAPTGVKAPISAYVSKLFQRDDVYGAALLAGTVRIIPIDELAQYDPYTIRLELQDELRLPQIDEDNFAKLMSALAIATTDLFHRNLPAFIEICNVFSGTPPNVDVFDPADVHEMAWAVAESQLIAPPDEPGEGEFSAEIRAYMGEMLRIEGWLTKPKILGMAVMPREVTPAEITEDAEMLPAMIAADDERHLSLTEVLHENTRLLVEQISPITGPLNV